MAWGRGCASSWDEGKGQGEDRHSSHSGPRGPATKRSRTTRAGATEVKAETTGSSSTEQLDSSKADSGLTQASAAAALGLQLA